MRGKLTSPGNDPRASMVSSDRLGMSALYASKQCCQKRLIVLLTMINEVDGADGDCNE